MRYLTRLHLVLPDREIHDGALLVADGRIIAVCPDSGGDAPELDGRGALCLPGLIDLHCDAVEKEIEPRPKVAFDHHFALVNSDRRNLCAGITTVFHAISFAGGEFGVRDPGVAGGLARAVRSVRGLVRHLVHARYEITDGGGEEPLAALIAEGGADLLSFMDHSPGQGQFREMAAYVAYMLRTYHTPEHEAIAFGEAKVANRPAGEARMARLAALARHRHCALASHDDDTPEKVAAMARLGVTISEFPIGLAAARAAVDAGLVTLFGAPNIVRGRSSGGNVRALDAVLAGCCTGLCADYHPPTLLAAALMLPTQAHLPLWEAVNMVTRNPARAAGLIDRGTIAPGQLADLVLVRPGTMAQPGSVAQVEAVMVGGRVVLDTLDRHAVREPACV